MYKNIKGTEVFPTDVIPSFLGIYELPTHSYWSEPCQHQNFQEICKRNLSDPWDTINQSEEKALHNCSKVTEEKKLVAGCGDMVISVIKLAVSGSGGTVICRLRNSWESTIAEHVATKHLEVIFIRIQMWLVKFTAEERIVSCSSHTLCLCEEIPAPQSQTENLFWGSIVEWLLFSYTPAEASIPEDKISGHTDLLPDMV